MKDTLTNPEELASSEQVKTYLRRCREAALAESDPTERDVERGLDIHRRAIVCDLLGGGRADSLYSPAMYDYMRKRLSEYQTSELDVSISTRYGTTGKVASGIREEIESLWPHSKEMGRNPDLQADHRALLAATGKTMYTTGSEGVEGLASFNHFFDEVDYVSKIVRIDQIEELKARGEWGILYHLHNGVRLREESKDMLDDLELYYRMGVRWSMLWGPGFGGRQWEPELGLTDRGREAVRRMNELNIIVDTSHCGPKTSLQIIEESQQPVIVSHVGCRAVHPGYCRGRNITDESMKAVAEKGGVVGISTIFTLLGENSIDMLMRHIDHAARLIGTDHIGLGSDQGVDLNLELPEMVQALKPKNWNTAYPWDLTSETRSQHAHMENANEANWKIYTSPHALSECAWPYNITIPLVQRGYSDEEIQNMLGGNFLRVARTIL